MRYRLNEPFLEGRERDYVMDVLRTGWLSCKGKHTLVFEREFAKTVGVKYALAVQSGTAAVHTAIMALGLGSKDKVIVPNYTCAGSIVGIIQCGAKPVILDIESQTFGLDVNLVNEYIKKIKPRALMIVHIYGFPARDTEEIVKLCRRHGVIVIEDCAEALGAKIGRRMVGTYGDIAVYSIRSEKMIGVGEGGMVLTDNKKLLERAFYWASRAAPYRNNRDLYWKTYEYTGVGMNYLLSHLLGAVGRAQIENFGQILARKRAVGMRYQKLLTGVEGIRLQMVMNKRKPVFWLNIAVMDKLSTKQVRWLGNELIKAGIEIRPAFWPLSDLRPFKAMRYGSQRVGMEMFYKGIILPSSVYLAENNCQKVNEIADIFLTKLRIAKKQFFRRKAGG